MRPASDTGKLAAALLELRTGWALTQHELGRVMRISVPLISSWEKGKSVPPVPRLEAYALVFAVRRPAAGERLRMPSLTDLSGGERAAYERLRSRLVDLRGALDLFSPAAPAGEASPFRFPPGQAITIVCSEWPAEYQRRMPYSNPDEPDYVEAQKYADTDALIELYGEVLRLNPDSPVRRTVASELKLDDRTAHLIVLGGIDFNKMTRSLLARLRDVPVSQNTRENEADEGAFTVTIRDTITDFRPNVIAEENRQVLKEDVALFLRAPNPYNRERTITLCNGMYARGSYGVARALSDPEFRDRNGRYIGKRFAGRETYCILCRVEVIAKEIVVPDWTLDQIRLFEWPEVAG